MGAQIEGIGSSHLIIDGVEKLHGADYDVMPDRIEAGSYACAAGITGGSIELVGARPEDMLAITNGLAQAGLMVEFCDKGIKVSADGKLKPLALTTAPFPGFPIVIACFRASGSLRSSGTQRTIGSSTPRMMPRSIAMPTSAEMMLLDADLMCARRLAR